MTETSARPRVAYILAPSHSGSTLLAMLLGSHPDVCTIGELSLGAIDDTVTYRCSCGERLTSCPFWQTITVRLAARGVRFDVCAAGTDFRGVPSRYVRRLLRPLHRGPIAEAVRDLALQLSPAWRAAYPDIQARNRALVDAICAYRGTTVIVDSSKTGGRLKFLLRNPDLDVRVIRLIRDGRAVAVSYMDPAEFADARDPRLRGGGAGGSRDHERLPVEAAAREWRRSHEEAEAIVRRLDTSRWMRIHYEALCEDTDATLSAVFRFLGVNPGAARRDHRQSDHHLVGNGMRLDTTSEVALDRRWTSVFTDAHRRAFDAVAGDLNRRYGYAG